MYTFDTLRVASEEIRTLAILCIEAKHKADEAKAEWEDLLYSKDPTNEDVKVRALLAHREHSATVLKHDRAVIEFDHLQRCLESERCLGTVDRLPVWTEQSERQIQLMKDMNDSLKAISQRS